MKAKNFVEAMNEIDDKYVDEAVRYRKKSGKYLWMKWGGAAAAIAVVIYAGSRIVSWKLPGTEFPQGTLGTDRQQGKLGEGIMSEVSGVGGGREELPILDISDIGDGVDAGFEGYLAKDISELVNGNPWKETMELSTLPVYRNPVTYDNHMIALGADFDKMRELLGEVVGRFGLNINELTVTDDVPDEKTKEIISEKLDGDVPEGYFNPTRLMTEADGMKIEVNQALTAKISFKPPIALPQEYGAVSHASYEEAVAVAEYLRDEYSDVIGIDNPHLNIYGGDYNIYHQQSYEMEFFDGSGNDVDQIIQYNFYPVAFYLDEEGNLFGARIYQPDLSQKVGDYPVITAERARELLVKGNYYTTVPCEMPGAGYVAKTELIYMTGEREQYYLPFYRFYVEVPELEREGGFKTYGSYYVPAVEESYLYQMPVWGEF